MNEKYCWDCTSANLAYIDQYACGEHWVCRECGKEICVRDSAEQTAQSPKQEEGGKR